MFPALFLALLVGQLDGRRARVAALSGRLIALALTPVLPPGLPIVAAVVRRRDRAAGAADDRRLARSSLVVGVATVALKAGGTLVFAGRPLPRPGRRRDAAARAVPAGRARRRADAGRRAALVVDARVAGRGAAAAASRCWLSGSAAGWSLAVAARGRRRGPRARRCADARVVLPAVGADRRGAGSRSTSARCHHGVRPAASEAALGTSHASVAASDAPPRPVVDPAAPEADLVGHRRRPSPDPCPARAPRRRPRARRAVGRRPSPPPRRRAATRGAATRCAVPTSLTAPRALTVNSPGQNSRGTGPTRASTPSVRRAAASRSPVAAKRVVHPGDRVGLAEQLVDPEAALVVGDGVAAGRPDHRLEAVRAGRGDGRREPRPQPRRAGRRRASAPAGRRAAPTSTRPR